MIYDNGHDSQLPEPGFLASITRAQVGGIELFLFFFRRRPAHRKRADLVLSPLLPSVQAFVATTLGQKTDIDMYMTAHRLACDHFGGWRKLGTAPRYVLRACLEPRGCHAGLPPER